MVRLWGCVWLRKGYEKGVLTHSKGRLLAYLVWFGRIRCVPSVSADVMRIIGYKSAGHWSLDVEELMDDGYIVFDKLGGCYKPTGKARSLLQPLVNLKRVAMLNTLASVVILLVGFIVYILSGQLLFYLEFSVSAVSGCRELSWRASILPAIQKSSAGAFLILEYLPWPFSNFRDFYLEANHNYWLKWS